MNAADVLNALHGAFPRRPLERRMRGGDCRVLSADPLVLFVADWVLADEPGALLPVFRQHRHHPVTLLVELSWSRDDEWHMGVLARWKTRHTRRHPNHRMIFLANSEAEHQRLTARGLGAAWVSHNAFVNPRTYQPLPGRAKLFDAVYDARICPFKRHELAVGIDNLALVTSRVVKYHDEAYIRSVRKILPRAHWFNDPLAPDYRSLAPEEINDAINQARVGLCLSAVEGAMFASVQYLLAGLPVVSTASRGGRDEFFDSDYVRIVADDPAAVAAGVREMTECPVPPEEIRRRTLERIARHEDRLFELLDAICFAEGRPRVPRSRWAAWTGPYPTTRVAADGIRKRIEDARRGLGDV
jgi:glycosyltransferase involved in cell wall biosynthesis